MRRDLAFGIGPEPGAVGVVGAPVAGLLPGVGEAGEGARFPRRQLDGSLESGERGRVVLLDQQQIAEPLVDLRIVGPESCRGLVTGERVVVPAKLFERLAELEMSPAIGRTKADRLAEADDGRRRIADRVERGAEVEVRLRILGSNAKGPAKMLRGLVGFRLRLANGSEIVVGRSHSAD